MNKKLLTLLLILPVALFAADKALGHDTPGGGKEKTRRKATEQVQVKAEPVAEAETATLQAEQTNATTISHSVQTSESTTTDHGADLKREIADLKASFDDQEGAEYQRYNDAAQIWLGDERLSADTREFLEKKALAPFKAANLFGINLEKSFSRCPSGYHITVVENEEGQVTDEGYLVRDQGCWDRPVARFRYNVAAEEVAVFVSPTVNIGLDEFLKLYKKAS
jgi:hypothetical protein